MKKSKKTTSKPDKLTNQADQLILAVETSGRLGSLALAQGPKLLAETNFTTPVRHSPELFPVISNLLERFKKEPHQIRQIYISSGPGSFTGLRVAVTLAKTMHLANAVKIVAVDSLDVIAANVINLTSRQNDSKEKDPFDHIATILDAKRGQFFIAAYEKQQNQWKKSLPDSLLNPDQFHKKLENDKKPVKLLGEGLLYHKDKFLSEHTEFFPEDSWYPKAEKVHLLGLNLAQKHQFADPLTLTPTYIQSPDIKQKKI